MDREPIIAPVEQTGKNPLRRIGHGAAKVMSEHLADILTANLAAGGGAMMVSADTLHPYFIGLCSDAKETSGSLEVRLYTVKIALMDSHPDIITEVSFWVSRIVGGDVINIAFKEYAPSYWIFEFSSQAERVQSCVTNIIFRAFAFRKGDPVLSREEAHSVLSEKSWFKISDTIGALSQELKKALEWERITKRPASLDEYPGLASFAYKNASALQMIPELFIEQPAIEVSRIKAFFTIGAREGGEVCKAADKWGEQLASMLQSRPNLTMPECGRSIPLCPRTCRFT